MRWEIRPLVKWPHRDSDPRTGSGRFTATWPSTVDLLARETEHLGAGLVVVQVDVLDGDIRRDGRLSARARVGHPGVVVSFDSVHGPLSYATDAYEARWSEDMPGWQANVRAVALALEALRAVDRHGVTRRGEQYQGWTQLSARPSTMTRDQAAEFILIWSAGGVPGAPVRWTVQQILADSDSLKRAYLAAMKHVHVDRDPSHADTTARLNQARDIITGRNQPND